MAEVESRLESSLVEKEFVLPHNRRDLLPVIYETGRILAEEPAEKGTRFSVRIDPKNWGYIEKELKGNSKKL